MLYTCFVFAGTRPVPQDESINFGCQIKMSSYLKNMRPVGLLYVKNDAKF